MMNKIYAAILGSLFLLMNFSNFSVQAQAIYNVSDVSVDVTAKDAAAARQQAINQAQRAAFNILLSRMLINPNDKQGLSGISSKELNEMIANYEVISERSSTIRYIANLSFRFRPESVKKFLRDSNVDYVEVISDRTLFLPVIVSQDQEILFENNNPWLENWQKLLPKFSFLSPVLPIGDIDDIQLINLEDDKVSITPDAYQRLLTKYKVQQIWLIKLDKNDNGGNNSKIEIFNFDITSNTFVLAEQLTLEIPSDDYGRLVSALLQSLEEKWKNEYLTNSTILQNVKIVARFSDQAGWYDIQDKLKRIQLIENFSITKIGSKFVEMDVQLSGSIDKLSGALRNYGFNIQTISQGIYQIELSQ